MIRSFILFAAAVWSGGCFGGDGAAVQAQNLQADPTLRLSDFRSATHRLGLDFRPSYVVPTHAFFEGENASGKATRTALSGHLKYSFQFDRQSQWGRLYPYAYQGIGLSYNYFDGHQELGSPVALYVFQGSRIATLSPSLSLDYEWNFGASFGWTKQAPIQHDFRGVVGSKINAYLNVGLLLNWHINTLWSVTAGIDLTHYSNGNTNYPNSGVNLVGGRLGVVRTFGDASEGVDGDVRSKVDVLSYALRTSDGDDASASTRACRKTWKPDMSYDLIVYGATRKRAVVGESPYMVPGSFGIVGLNFTPMVRLNRYFRAGASLDAQYDESANIDRYWAGGTTDDPKFYRPPFREQFAVGLSARGELVMPIFSLNMGIGYNVFQQGHDMQGWYQVLALKTFVTRRLFLHVGYQLHKFKDPNNLMLGLGWRM